MLTTTSSNRSVTDRRKQPQVSLQAVQSALAEINWPIREVTQQKFFRPAGKRANESYGYVLNVPKHLPVKELWVGFISHQKAPAGIYAALNPDLGHSPVLTPRDTDYKMSEFGKYLLMKQILPLAEVRALERQYGADDLTKYYKKVLRRVYPFSAPHKCAQKKAIVFR